MFVARTVLSAMYPMLGTQVRRVSRMMPRYLRVGWQRLGALPTRIKKSSISYLRSSELITASAKASLDNDSTERLLERRADESWRPEHPFRIRRETSRSQRAVSASRKSVASPWRRNDWKELKLKAGKKDRGRNPDDSEWTRGYGEGRYL